MEKLNLMAKTTFGVEAVVSRELKKLGYADQIIENGRVNFKGDYEAICRTNLWLRAADRVVVKVGEFEAFTFDDLFEGTKALPWENWIPENGEFPVEGSSINSKLASISDCQAIVKKAIVERLKKTYKRSWFEETGEKYKIEVALLKDIATLTIDTTGPGLHKRGYRKLVGEAPLKETLACAMLMISRWQKDRVLIDPFCGTGTIPIEAAMIAKNVAPGLNRKFAAEEWPVIPANLWEKARCEAMDMIDKEQILRIQGTDINEEAISLARYHAKEAGVEDIIHLQTIPVSKISSRYKYGFIITNPPYGERTGNIKSVENLYREMGEIFKRFDTWSFYILSSHPEFEKYFGRKADKKRKLYNGGIMCNYYQYFGPPPKNGLTDKKMANFDSI